MVLDSGLVEGWVCSWSRGWFGFVRIQAGLRVNFDLVKGVFMLGFRIL